MIEISNLRKYSVEGGLVRLEADINFTGMKSPYKTKTIYFEIDAKHADMLADDTYDAFVLVPLYVAMYHKQDLHIHGNVSKKFFKNINWYVQKIMCDFSEALSPVKFTVDGFTQPKPKGNLIGTGISCGVDCLSTIYDHYIDEDDPDYRINALFLFSHEPRSHLKDPSGGNVYQNLLKFTEKAAEDLGLPHYTLDTNLSVFTYPIMKKLRVSMSYIAMYSSILSLSNAICLYYVSSGRTYEEVKKFPTRRDFEGFCESYFVPLIQNEQIELKVDGCQYRRVDKMKKIADWDIAQKYLNVCTSWKPNHRDASNCGVCSKCLRTLLPLEILGKLKNFSDVFNIEKYRKISRKYKVRCLQNYGKNPFESENVDFARENNFPMPTLPAPAAKKSVAPAVSVAEKSVVSLKKE